MQKQLYLATLVIGALIGASALSTLAAGTWNPAPPSPPAGNVDAPINVGTGLQEKLGSLLLDNNVGILGNLIIATGTPAAGKVLTAVDETGTVTWTATSSLGSTGNGSGTSLPSCSNGQTLQMVSGAWTCGSMSVPQVSSYTSSGKFTWTKPSNARSIHVLVIGGGGNGNLTFASNAGIQGILGPSGNSGKVATFSFPASSIPDSVQVTVGAGGNGYCSQNPTPINGGQSSFGTFLVAQGGLGLAATDVTVGTTVNGVTYGSGGRGGFFNVLIPCVSPNGGTGAVFIETE